MSKDFERFMNSGFPEGVIDLIAGHSNVGYSKISEDLRALAELAVEFDLPILTATQKSTEPKHNLTMVSDDVAELDVLIAGFTKNEVKIVRSHYPEEKITITGTVEGDSVSGCGAVRTEFYKKDFELVYKVTEFAKITKAKAKLGILTLVIENQVPESMQDCEITIS